MGVAAHDLKAPLAAIQSYLGVMLGGFAGELPRSRETCCRGAACGLTSCLTLISDLLDIPRIETGQIVQEMKEISLQQVITRSLQEHA